MVMLAIWVLGTEVQKATFPRYGRKDRKKREREVKSRNIKANTNK